MSKPDDFGDRENEAVRYMQVLGWDKGKNCSLVPHEHWILSAKHAGSSAAVTNDFTKAVAIELGCPADAVTRGLPGYLIWTAAPRAVGDA